jgi:hypothetical protein
LGFCERKNILKGPAGRLRGGGAHQLDRLAVVVVVVLENPTANRRPRFENVTR